MPWSSSFPAAPALRTVITSYSIHYTKLYDGPLRQGRMNVTRLSRLMGLDCGQPLLPPETPAGRLSGSWYDPSHSGEGYVLEVLTDGRALVYWFSFDGEGKRRCVITSYSIHYTKLYEMDLLTMIGFIILLGLVVNNAILLVDQTRRAEREGLDREAAVRHRITSYNVCYTKLLRTASRVPRSDRSAGRRSSRRTISTPFNSSPWMAAETNSTGPARRPRITRITSYNVCYTKLLRSTLINCAVRRMRSPEVRTLPSRIVRTFSSRPIWRMSCILSRNAKEEVRAATRSPFTWARRLRRNNFV